MGMGMIERKNGGANKKTRTVCSTVLVFLFPSCLGSSCSKLPMEFRDEDEMFSPIVFLGGRRADAAPTGVGVSVFF